MRWLVALMVVVALLAACSAGGNADSESAPTTGLESTTSSAESTASEPSPSTRSWTTDVVEPLPPESSELPGATDVESAWPEYSWATVRPCRATAAAPRSSAIRPASKYVTCSSSIPTRIFTVTGTGPAADTAALITEAKRRRL